MKTYKDRYRRIPIELTLLPAYDDFSPDAKLAYLNMIISPRQNQAGIYDGGTRSLSYETGLNGKRLKAAVVEVEKARLIEPIASGGWWIKDTYRWQVCNEGYERAAIRQRSDRWPDILPKFQEYNAGILVRKDKPVRGGSHPPSDPPPTGVLPPTVVQGSVVQIPEVQRTGVQDSDTGGRGLQGNGEGADTRDAPLGGASASVSPQETEKGNGKPTPPPPSGGKSRPPICGGAAFFYALGGVQGESNRRRAPSVLTSSSPTEKLPSPLSPRSSTSTPVRSGPCPRG